MALLVTRSTRPVDTEGPTAPTITASATGTSTVQVTRTVLATDISGILNYETQRSLQGAGAWTSFDFSNTTPLTAAGLAAGTAYEFRQRAFDTLGNAGSFSPTVSATTNAELSNYYAGPEFGYLTPTLYAAPTTQGTGSGNSEANAMTLTAALAAATAGSIIGVLPGVYSTAGGAERYSPAWRVNNTGTAANPIIVVAKYSAIDLAGKTGNQRWTSGDLTTVFAHSNRSELRHTGVSTNGAGTGGPAFGSVDVNYVWWIGLCADETTAEPHRDSGLTILWSTTGSRIMRCVLFARDPGYTTDTGDNHPNVRLENAVNCTVSDNVLYGSFAGSGHNHCCIQRYESRGTVLEHNFTFGLHTGIYMKDQDTARSEIIRYNYTANPSCGIEILNVNIGVSDIDQVYQNLIVDSTEGVIFQSQGFNIQAHHNTIVVPATAFGSAAAWVSHFAGTGCYMRESIIVGTSGSAFVDQSFRTAAVNGSNYNRYFRTGTTFSARYNGLTHSSLAAWQAATGQDANSSVGTPSFVNQASGDYHLVGGSACLTMSSTGGPVGCYITGSETIGPRYA